MSGTCTYKVRIDYREPTYQLLRDRPERVYTGSFEVTAADAPAAEAAALAEFRRIESLSSVGWIRQVVAVSVERT